MKPTHFCPLVILSFFLLWGCASQRSANAPYGAPSPSAPRPTVPAQAPRANRPYRIHVVKEGDTLWHISRLYNISLHTLISVNHIQNPSHLIAGSQLIIPSRHYTHLKKVTFLSSAHASAGRKEGFIWPVKGKIITFFGKSKSKISKGIVIQAPLGTRVKAAQSGKVVYSGTYGPFGHTVILQHPDGYSSVYAHNQKNLVKVGQWVSQGQTIATVGMTGHITCPCLQFEIRKKSQAVDPLIYLRSP